MARRDPLDTSEDPPEASGQSDDLIRELAKASRSGDSRSELRERLNNMGFEGAEAEAMLDAATGGGGRASGARAAPVGSGGGLPRVLVWVLVLVGINVISYVFHLGFWFW